MVFEIYYVTIEGEAGVVMMETLLENLCFLHVVSLFGSKILRDRDFFKQILKAIGGFEEIRHFDVKRNHDSLNFPDS